MKNYEPVEISHNPYSSYIPDHPYRILIVGGSGSGKATALLNLIKYPRSDTTKCDFFSLSQVNEISLTGYKFH